MSLTKDQWHKILHMAQIEMMNDAQKQDEYAPVVEGVRNLKCDFNVEQFPLAEVECFTEWLNDTAAGLLAIMMRETREPADAMQILERVTNSVQGVMLGVVILGIYIGRRAEQEELLAKTSWTGDARID